jgi:hypothetical protein
MFFCIISYGTSLTCGEKLMLLVPIGQKALRNVTISCSVALKISDQLNLFPVIALKT